MVCDSLVFEVLSEGSIRMLEGKSMSRILRTIHIIRTLEL